MKLDVLICCYNKSINHVGGVLLKPRNDVQYIIAHQYDNPEYSIIPDFLDREDVKVVQIFGKGLSKNRNNALRNSTSEICLIGDDDVIYTHQSFNTIIEEYKQNKDKDIILFKIKTLNNGPEYKAYPTSNYLITRGSFKHYISSIEITFKRENIIKNNIFFDERFGLGSKYFCMGGEDEILINDCLKKKMRVYYVNKFIVEHEFMSSGKLLQHLPITDKLKQEIAHNFRIGGGAYLFSSIINYRHYVHSINVFKYFAIICIVLYVLLFKKRF